MLEDEELDELLLEELLVLEVLDEELELLLEDELLELDELLGPPGPEQDGPLKLPSCVPWKPKPVLPPGPRACQLQQLLAVYTVGPPDSTTFQLPWIFAFSAKLSVTAQLFTCVVPSFRTVTFTW